MSKGVDELCMLEDELEELPYTLEPQAIEEEVDLSASVLPNGLVARRHLERVFSSDTMGEDTVLLTRCNGVTVSCHTQSSLLILSIDTAHPPEVDNPDGPIDNAGPSG